MRFTFLSPHQSTDASYTLQLSSARRGRTASFFPVSPTHQESPDACCFHWQRLTVWQHDAGPAYATEPLPVQCCTCSGMHTTLQSRALLWSVRAGRSCQLPWRTVHGWKSCLLNNYHAGHHDSEWPDVQRIMIVLIRDEQLRALEISGTHSNIVVLFRQVELGQAPVNYSDLPLLQRYLLLLVVDHHILRLDVPVHNA